MSILTTNSSRLALFCSVLFIRARVQPTLDPCAEAFCKQAQCASPLEEFWGDRLYQTVVCLSCLSRYCIVAKQLHGSR